MPYASNAELPPAVKKFSVSLQTAWRKAFNSAFKTYNGDESRAFATAWATVNRMRESTQFHPSFLRIQDLFHSRYGEELGTAKFVNFLLINGLDTSKRYDPHVQFNESTNESFTWAEPFIRFMKQDKQAKYYAVRALHAIVSMNRNDYTDIEDMENAAISMNYRPLNYNHDHTRWLPYPRTRVEYAKAEDMCVECILRVDNQDEYLQKQLDHDPGIPKEEWINHPSIEGRPMLGGAGKGYHFMALAMLEKGYQLPGDPLSEIYPIMMEGVQGGEVCLMVNGERVCLECESALTEGKEMNDEYKIGEINHGGAVCPNCDHIVNLDGIKIPSEVDCPNCGTPMKARPGKTVEATEEDLSREAPNTSMSSSPEDVVIETPEEVVVEPPTNELADSLKKKADEAFKMAETMSISELKVEIAKNHADLAYKTADLTELETKLRELKNVSVKDANEARDQIQDLSSKLASKIREVATLEYLKTRVTEATQEIGEKKGEIDDLNVRISVLEESIVARDSKISGLEKDHTTLRADYEKLRMQHEDVRKDRNDLSVKTRAAEEKALNETRERSRIALDNADLLDKQRELTAEISKLSERIANGANVKLEQEKRIVSLEEATRDTEDATKKKLKEAYDTIEKAKKFHSWAWQQLKEAGISIVSE